MSTPSSNVAMKQNVNDISLSNTSKLKIYDLDKPPMFFSRILSYFVLIILGQLYTVYIYIKTFFKIFDYI